MGDLFPGSFRQGQGTVTFNPNNSAQCLGRDWTGVEWGEGVTVEVCVSAHMPALYVYACLQGSK